jgi:hypothetical protein
MTLKSSVVDGASEEALYGSLCGGERTNSSYFTFDDKSQLGTGARAKSRDASNL